MSARSINAVGVSTESRIQSSQEWKSLLTGLTVGLLSYESLSGLMIYFLPFSVFNQYSVLLHTAIGCISLVPVGWYGFRHWWVRRGGNLSHYQLLGYLAVMALTVCCLSGAVLTYEAAFRSRITRFWDLTHLFSGIALILFTGIHLVMLLVRPIFNQEQQRTLRQARLIFYCHNAWICILGLFICFLWSQSYPQKSPYTAFSENYNWKFGEDRPFAPSLARLDTEQWQEPLLQEILGSLPDGKQEAFQAVYEKQKAEPVGLFAQLRTVAKELTLDAPTLETMEELFVRYAQISRQKGALPTGTLAHSASCGTTGCHEEIYREWLPSAHRYASLDGMFQKVQEIMAVETSPEHTRYCAGCHDPISLFNGAKNSSNITLSTEGADEGVSCLVCHSIIQTDTQGNADYTMQAPVFYLYERSENKLEKFASDFLIRAYPHHHVRSYSRELYKTAEYCGACHKQYIDKDVNTDIGRVQGQNQYDSWRTSRWNEHKDSQKDVTCRECHMPLAPSLDPAAGDPHDYYRQSQDGKHRGHRFLASNQYIPTAHNLENAAEHVLLTEQWLRGEIEIPEIAHKWTSGPVVRLEIMAPETAKPGEMVALQVLLTNNKAGHDFPTGPLDMIESWLEIKVSSHDGVVLYHSGVIDSKGAVLESPVIFKSEGVDRKGQFIDRHNLWDLVGAKYKRALFAGLTDTVNLEILCPSLNKGSDSASDQRESRQEFTIPSDAKSNQLTVTAVLWYRKANAMFLDRIYGVDAGIRSPVSGISRTERVIQVVRDETQS